jgi:hypothetical protein
VRGAVLQHQADQRGADHALVAPDPGQRVDRRPHQRAVGRHLVGPLGGVVGGDLVVGQRRRPTLAQLGDQRRGVLGVVAIDPDVERDRGGAHAHHRGVVLAADVDDDVVAGEHRADHRGLGAVATGRDPDPAVRGHGTSL